jgi:hypothetical protein
MARRGLCSNARRFLRRGICPGRESGGLQSLAAGLAARDIRFDLLGEGEVQARAAKRGSGPFHG